MRDATCFLFAVLLVVLLNACASWNGVHPENLSNLYDREASLIHPDFLVYHSSVDSSKIYFQLKSEELLYTRSDQDQPFKARIRFHYEVSELVEEENMIDSASIEISSIQQSDQQALLIGDFTIPLASGKNYSLKLITSDRNRNQRATRIISINKTRTSSSQNFCAFDALTGTPLFNHIIDTGNVILVQHNQTNLNQLPIRFYQRSFPLPSPPFSTDNVKPFKYRADAMLKTQKREKGYYRFHAANSGFYHIQTDTSGKQGMTLFTFDTHFPRVETVEAMIAPIRYITSEKEYNKIIGSKNAKQTLDRFWLQCAGSKQRAREIIRAFYKRVEESNIYFTSYIEGWKTDRGLVNIIYGTPNIIYKSPNAETWIYGEENNMMSLSFNFYKIDNPFTNNDYRLSRNPIYKTSWYRAVESWRSGKVFSN